MKPYTISGTVYPYDVIVGIGCEMKDIIKYGNKKYVNPFTDKDLEAMKIEDTTNGRSVMLENNALVLWTRNTPISPDHIGILAHEIFHIADMTLYKVGLELTPESDEAWAHYIHWLTKEIYKKI